MGKVRKLWSYNQIKLAINAIRSGETISSVSKRTGIPKTTLSEKFTGKSPLFRKLGNVPVLTNEEEKVIVEWILNMNNQGLIVTKAKLLNKVESFVKNLNRITPFNNNRPGRHWYEGFRRRHPDVLSVKQKLIVTRSVTDERLKAWFQETEMRLDKIGIETFDGTRIFCFDEMPFFICPISEQHYTEQRDKGVKNYVKHDENEFLSVVLTSNVIGMLSPPMAFFNFKNIPKSITESAPPDWIIEKTNDGYVTVDLLQNYIKNVFHPWLTENNIERPVVLYVDGNLSEMIYSLTPFCSENQIELIPLYPNATHILHPLDVVLFKPLKEVWSKFILNTKNQNQIQKEDICPLLTSVLESLNLPVIMCNGFRKTGLYPFTPKALNYNEFFPKPKLFDLEKYKHIAIAKKFLRFFESFIDSKVLKEFQEAEKNGHWGGDSKHESLFFFWLTILCSSRAAAMESNFKTTKFVVNYKLEKNSEDSSLEDKKLEVVLLKDEGNDENPIIFPADNSSTPKKLYSYNTETVRITNKTSMENLELNVDNEFKDNIPATEIETGSEKRKRKIRKVRCSCCK